MEKSVNPMEIEIMPAHPLSQLRSTVRMDRLDADISKIRTELRDLHGCVVPIEGILVGP